MKITGTRSKIWVDLEDGRIAEIEGEMIVGGFVAERDSIKNWQVPAGIPITASEKQEIIEGVVNKTKNNPKMKITFE